MNLRVKIVSEEEWRSAHARTGSVYFVRNDVADMVKIGHSHNPERRLIELQVGSGQKLEIIGIMAAPIEIEALIHHQLTEGAAGGEWFWDREIASGWLHEMTQGNPLRRSIWSIEKGDPQ